MDLAVQLIVGIAWPVTVLILVIVFRRDLANAVAKITKLRYKDFEAEFQTTLRELESQRPAELALPAATSARGRSLLDRRKEISSLTAASPRAAVMEAWVELERAILDAARRAEVPVEKGVGTAIRLLSLRRVVSSEYAGAVERVRRLRNLAAHEPEFTLSETEAKEYVYYTLDLAASIELLAQEREFSGVQPGRVDG
jgi:hypothetical protein